MPLIIVSGLPSSGKTTVSQKILEYFIERLEREGISRQVKIVSDSDNLDWDGRDTIYMSIAKEKELRGWLKSEAQRYLNLNQIVILDAAAYIKGFRYELHCVSKEAKTQYCVVECLIDLATCWQWNEDLKTRLLQEAAKEPDAPDPGYQRETFDALVARYEPCDESNRWDSPLIKVTSGQDDIDLEKIFDVILNGEPLLPNKCTTLAYSTTSIMSSTSKHRNQEKVLYLIGLGLGDAKDITLKGLEIVKSVSKVYLENYTSILCCGQKDLEDLYGRSITLVDREMMEQGCGEILDSAQDGGAAVLVVGDPLNATTHTDLLLRAANRRIPYKIIHNASIINAVACCGLQIYNFGETVSIPFWTDSWKPESFYDKILRNKSNGLHTLCLLDIKVKEPNLDLLVKGIQKMDPPRFMSFSTAAEQLVSIIRSRRGKHSSEQASIDTNNHEDLKETDICIGLARVGNQYQKIVKTTLLDATAVDLGAPLHSLVIPGSMHPLEEEMITLFSEQ